MALFSVSIADNVVYWVGYYEINPHLLGISLPFVFIYGPLFYIFLYRTNQSKTKMGKADWWHFVPFILVELWYMQYYLTNTSDKLVMIAEWNNSFVNALLLPFLGLVSLVVYAILSFRFIVELEKKYVIKIHRSGHWLGLIFIAYGLFVLFNILHFISIIFGKSNMTSDTIIALGYSVFIYFIGYLGLKMSKLFNGIKVDNTKYQTTSLPRNFSLSMFNKLTAYIESHESFKNNELKLSELADELSLSPHQLSQIINQNADQNFSEFINSYRIKEALKLISKMDRIGELSYEVGFNNRTTFNKEFKKATGLTPTEYKKKNVL
jgi:AraC-like DNA-binding protein